MAVAPTRHDFGLTGPRDVELPPAAVRVLDVEASAPIGEGFDVFDVDFGPVVSGH
ncbi:hypothetical protein [Halospeciosus flavus]|uniref:hypothetical protein n=1 Tax=Halospeciosus flavus TaxID=3032283 RepID=UPI00360AD51A